jgi:predicted SAM-dependent methyltransferase
MLINLGSGNAPMKDHVNVDMLMRDDVDVIHNLMDFPYPFGDGVADSIKAMDVIEHLDNYTDDKRPTIIAFVEECHRILKVGGELYIQTPSWDSELFKIDVTHVRGFNIKSFDFFDPETEYGEIRAFYSNARFKVKAKELKNKNLRFWMYKI